MSLIMVVGKDIEQVLGGKLDGASVAMDAMAFPSDKRSELKEVLATLPYEPGVFEITGLASFNLGANDFGFVSSTFPNAKPF